MDIRAFVEGLVSFESTAGNEAEVASWFEKRLAEFGFETYTWEADAEALAGHPSFPDDPAAIDAAGRPSVGGVLELGSSEGPTVVLNGHYDVVPADGTEWSSPPFEPTWDGDELTARGAADMKSGLAACVYAALALEDRDVDGRVVVEGVAGEEDGGLGAATAARSNPYPFERDAAIIAEPTALTPVVASEGSVMMRLTMEGRSAHAATPWRGVDVVETFAAVREAFFALERERTARIDHPLYEGFPRPWPVVCGTVDAGAWASMVPAGLTAEWRIGVAPGETVEEVETAFRARLDEVVADDEWLTAHPPTFERFSVQFEPSEIAPDESIVEAVRAALRADDRDHAPAGVTYGADARHYIDAGIPTVLFGPGSIEQAHFPDETVDFRAVEQARDCIADAVAAYFARYPEK
ncbi:M20 family metallopeptidase [Natronomonas sp. EA1]|uniref:M20 family metallopeptidase n=1 Tax=Natronomonas sp. EA1 TaxID=3421655 RepID=UPI003EBCEC4B